jgi:hypothetical protein
MTTRVSILSNWILHFVQNDNQFEALGACFQLWWRRGEKAGPCSLSSMEILELVLPRNRKTAFPFDPGAGWGR